MTQSYYRGHKIYFADGLWIYSDTLQPVRYNKNRLCGKCKQDNTAEGHDTCLGTLPGLMNACCGHGKTKEAYIQFLDGFSIHGKKAKIIQEILKGKRNGHTDTLWKITNRKMFTRSSEIDKQKDLFKSGSL